MLFYNSRHARRQGGRCVESDLAFAAVPYLAAASHGLFERGFSRTRYGFYCADPYRLGAELLARRRLFEIGFFSYMFTLATSVMPFVLLCATFTFLYKLMPYTNVRFSSALVGGATAGDSVATRRDGIRGICG